MSETTSEPEADGAVLIIGTCHEYQRHQDQKERGLGLSPSGKHVAAVCSQ